MDKSLLGLPKEGYGFSGPFNGKIIPPSYKDSSIYVNKNTDTIVYLYYW